jgi:hypothetical protein
MVESCVQTEVKRGFTLCRALVMQQERARATLKRGAVNCRWNGMNLTIKWRIRCFL